MSHVETRVEGHVLVIHINRPEKYNALSVEIYHALGAALARLEQDASLRVGLIHAAGRNFTAGIELDQWAPIFREGRAFPFAPGNIDPFGLTGPQHGKPLVIAVQGYCFTWGVELLLNCEVRVAARDTQFQMLEVQRGLYPCAGATIRLPREIGWGNACCSRVIAGAQSRRWLGAWCRSSPSRVSSMLRRFASRRGSRMPPRSRYRGCCGPRVSRRDPRVRRPSNSSPGISSR